MIIPTNTVIIVFLIFTANRFKRIIQLGARNIEVATRNVVLEGFFIGCFAAFNDICRFVGCWIFGIDIGFLFPIA
jgi:hypothetical protein